jgi:hypothetical protein
MRVCRLVSHRRNGLGGMIFSPSRRELVSKHSQRGAPPISGMLKRDMLGKAMSSDMSLRNRLPCAVLDRYAGFFANGFEAHFDLGRLFGREVRLPPCEDEALAGLPNCNSSNLEFVTIIERRPQRPAADLRALVMRRTPLMSSLRLLQMCLQGDELTRPHSFSHFKPSF